MCALCSILARLDSDMNRSLSYCDRLTIWETLRPWSTQTMTQQDDRLCSLFFYATLFCAGLCRYR